MSDPKRILVVDDQVEIVDLTETVLRAEGFEVESAGNGRDALCRAFSSRFDLVLLDINMPEMDGWETLRLLKADERLTEVPVVMFSIKGEIRDQVHGLQLGAAGYITKPYAVDDLVGQVREVLAGSPA